MTVCVEGDGLPDELRDRKLIGALVTHLPHSVHCSALAMMLAAPQSLNRAAPIRRTGI